MIGSCCCILLFAYLTLLTQIMLHPYNVAKQAASPRESSDAALSANHEAQPTSSNRGRPEEATADSEAPAPQPKPKKRVRWADEALNKPIAVCQVSANCPLSCLWDHLLLVSLGEYKSHDHLPAQYVVVCPHTLLIPRSAFWLWAYITSSTALRTPCARRGILAFKL